MPVLGMIGNEANIVRRLILVAASNGHGSQYLRNKMNGLVLVKDVMLEPYEVANFNAVILSHCAISNIEMPVTVVAPFVH